MLHHEHEGRSHICMGIGIVVGILIGAAIHNLPMATGGLMCLGIAMDYLLSKKNNSGGDD